MFFHPIVLAKKIIKEIDKLEGDLYETHGRIELCLPQNLIGKFPKTEDREKLTEFIWDVFHKIKIYDISRYVFNYNGTKYILVSQKKEWDLEIKAFIKLWEGETEIILIPSSIEKLDDPDLENELNKENCKIIKFPTLTSKN